MRAKRIARSGAYERLMWMTPERVFYYGLLGAPSLRRMGSYTLYVAVEGRSIGISIEGGKWETAELAVVPPYVAHQVVTEARLIHTLHIEADTVAPELLPAAFKGRGAARAPQFVETVRRRRRDFLEQAAALDLLGLDFDQTFFGARLAPLRIDHRIVKVLEWIRQHPSAPGIAEECAAIAHLSRSRFLHLFKEEVGAPFRNYRTWKRARNLLQYVTQDINLANVALDTGYPDSTHFSHSIRQVYGLMPREMFAGSRRLALFNQAPSSKPVAQLPAA